MLTCTWCKCKAPIRPSQQVVSYTKGGALVSLTGSMPAQIIQLAQHYGFKTINLVRRREQVQEIKEAGCGTASQALQMLSHMDKHVLSLDAACLMTAACMPSCTSAAVQGM